MRLVSLPDVVKLMCKAEKDLESEMARMERECDQFIKDIERINGNMSDLIYSKVGPEGIGEKQATNELQEFIKQCDQIIQSTSIKASK
ncbi:13395_t:CDS:2 [Ambispora gerdemannii]|uniref:13395_t:CDS:1 n=1 Tax=Ambispora gerdemannii TaxID=144530 RepID=A0A9N9FCX0_9GLOM|nr:13395_t:CDS:2 [Ambispora gerdemannii]